MNWKNYFNYDVDVDKTELRAAAAVRVGLDLAVEVTLKPKDWVLPFLFIPTLRGFHFKVWFLGMFVGRVD